MQASINWSTNSCFFWKTSQPQTPNEPRKSYCATEGPTRMSTAMHMFQPSETCTHGLFLGISTGCPACWQNCQFTRQQSQDWWLTSWKQFGNANLEKIAHPGKTPKKKKIEISAHPLWIAIRASKHQGQNWVEWSHRLLRAWSSWPYPARVPQENVVQDILASQFVQPHLTKHYLGESIKDHANHFVVYLLPNGLSAILTYNARNVQLQVVAYLDKLVLLGYVWVGKRDDR